MSTSPFDYVNSINETKQNMMRGTSNDRLMESGYVPYIANRALSYHFDTVLIANMVNQYHQLDKRPQYEFLLNTVRRGRRYAKWVKDGDSDLIDVIGRAYKCSRAKAKQHLALLTPEQIRLLKKQQEQGGRESGKTK